MIPAWIPKVFAIELKKALSYRAVFWFQFIFGTFTEIVVAYFIWSAVFSARDTDRMQGFTLYGIVLYYLFASFSAKIARGSERGYIAQDIYDGGLTRYLVYPLSFFGFKYVTHLTQQVLGLIQLVIALAWFRLFIPAGTDSGVTFASFCAGALTCFLAGYLHFVISSCIELVAFWQDVIWNLTIMLRFGMALLGGAMIPLAFFPEWGQKLVALTPFPAIISFPAQTFLNKVTMIEWWQNVGILAAWSLLFTFGASVIYFRGLKKYSGVGI